MWWTDGWVKPSECKRLYPHVWRCCLQICLLNPWCLEDKKYASRWNDPFCSQKRTWLLTFFPVSSILKECFRAWQWKPDQMEAIWQYWSSSLAVWSAWPSHVQCCYCYRTVHCDTREAARGFGNRSRCSPGPTEALTNEASLCIFVCVSVSVCVWIHTLDPSPKLILHLIVCTA